MLTLAQISTMSPEELENYYSNNPDELAGMDHSTLYQLRDHLGRNSAMQNTIAPYEHRAFAREATQDNPFMALPIAAAMPMYQIAKLYGNQSRSGASLNQLLQGITGIGEGLYNRYK